MRHGFEAPSRDDPAMTAAALAEAAARLSLLERYLREDPANLALLADACDTAIAAGLHERAAALIEAAQQLGVASDLRDAFQQLWLRAAHRAWLLQEGIEWATREHEAARLLPGACGVASLLAIDAGQFAAARALAEAADESQAEASVARACLALAEGRPDAALPGLERAERARPEDGRIQATIGLCALQAGDLAGAQKRFERALAGSMQAHVGTWHALGWARLLQGNRAGAQAAFAQALTRDRNFAESHGAMALVLGLGGEAAQAAQHLRAADKLDAANVTGRYARAVLAGEARDAGQVQALVKRLLARPGLSRGSLADDALAVLRRSHNAGAFPE
jgi:Tfp pilus assembly protein PilF